MTKTVRRLLSKARTLDPIERAEIIEGLYSTFDFPGDKEIDAAWLKLHDTEKKLRSAFMKLYVAYL